MSRAKAELYNPWAGLGAVLLDSKLAQRSMGEDRYRRSGAADYYEAVFRGVAYNVQVAKGREALEQVGARELLDRLATELIVDESHVILPHTLRDQNGWFYAAEVLEWGPEFVSGIPSLDPQRGVYIASSISGNPVVGLSFGEDRWQTVTRFALHEGKKAWKEHSKYIGDANVPTLEDRVRFAIGNVRAAERRSAPQVSFIGRLFRRGRYFFPV